MSAAASPCSSHSSPLPPLAGARFVIGTPFGEGGGGNAGGAIAVVQLIAGSAAELEAIAARLALPLPRVGGRALRRVLDVDDAVLARVTDRSLLITPHGGGLILRRLAEALESRGIPRVSGDAVPVNELYPEAADELEAQMLRALSRAASPLAIGVLLRQPALWRAHRASPRASEAEIVAHSRAMNRLLEMPTVAAVGAPNIGKSTLLNALARREAALVADQPGTTRDHVGVTLDLAGLAVRWIDTPGLTAESLGAAALDSDGATSDWAIDHAAAVAALGVIRGADVVVLCADGTKEFIDPAALGVSRATPVIRCATRADVAAARGGADVVTAAARREGIEALAIAVRGVLVPDSHLESNVPWRFDPAL